LFAGLSLVLAACVSTPPPPPPPDPVTQMSALESRINTLIEEQRLRLNPNAQPLVLDSELVGIARRRSADMAQRNTFSNPGDDTHVSATMMMDQDATFQGLLGENVAAQHYTKQSGVDVDAFAKRFVDTWLASDPHRTNLSLKDYNRTGVGAAVNADTVYVTQLFATDLGLGPYKDTTTPKKVTEFQDPQKAVAPQPVAAPALRMRGSEGVAPNTPGP